MKSILFHGDLVLCVYQLQKESFVAVSRVQNLEWPSWSKSDWMGSGSKKKATTPPSFSNRKQYLSNWFRLNFLDVHIHHLNIIKPNHSKMGSNIFWKIEGVWFIPQKLSRTKKKSEIHVFWIFLSLQKMKFIFFEVF